jgi:hypothetical protein
MTDYIHEGDSCPVSGPRFETGTFRILKSSDKHSAAEFGRTIETYILMFHLHVLILITTMIFILIMPTHGKIEIFKGILLPL